MEDRLIENTANFETDFTILDSAKLLKITHGGQVNRSLATQERIGITSFSAVLSRVQYGTYQKAPACLVVLDFSFRFKSKSVERYCFATIEVDFTFAKDPKQPRLKNDNPEKDPTVKNLAPKEVYGIVKTEEQKKFWNIAVPAMFESPVGAKAGVTFKGGSESHAFEDNRAEIHGNLLVDDDHPNGPNGVTWDLSENQGQHDGIIRSFTGAIIVQNPAEQPLWMNVVVKPSVRFSLDLRRLAQKGDPVVRLLQKNDDPVFLDGKTNKEGQVDLGCTDFSSEEFPWERVLHFPGEYQNQLTMRSAPEKPPPPTNVQRDRGTGSTDEQDPDDDMFQ